MEEIKKTSMQEIADYLNISKNAVSLALGNKKGVSEELRKKVFDAARLFNYGGMKSSSETISRNVLAITPEFMGADSAFYNKLFWAIEKECRNRGLNLIITCIDESMEKTLKLPRMLSDMSIAGIILVGVLSREYLGAISSLKLPMVIVDNNYYNTSISSILTANEEGAYEAVKYLIECGHREIGYIGPVGMASSFDERYQGYIRAMNNSSIEINREFCFITSKARHLPIDEEIKTYVDSLEVFPTAWFCGNDTIALSLLQVLNEKNINVPKDISVMGFDDIETSQLVIPRLTTVRVKRDIMGMRAVQQLFEEMSYGENKIKINIYTELVIRDSVNQIDK